MNIAIARVSIIPLRKESSDKSEMVSQVLFGECVEILKKEKQWLHVKCLWDGYTGWLDEKQIQHISVKYYEQYKSHVHSCSSDISYAIIKEDIGFPIVMGSSLPFYDGLCCKIEKEKYIFNGSVLHVNDIKDFDTAVEKIALKYLHSPYLWGGRSPFGIDCSGFTQIVYKLLGKQLNRDAYEQIEHGNNVDFIETSKPGDLAFFHNKEGKIIHVGIILKNQQIIHASGYVRIDKIDNHGIFNAETKKYSHNLKLIKRIL